MSLISVLLGVLILPASAVASGAPPGVSTTGASGVTYSSATLYAYINPHGLATTYAFQYGTTAGYGGETPLAPAGNGTISIKLSQVATGLQPGTAYHFRVVGVNSAGTSDGKDRTFKTAPVPLSVQIAGVPNPVAFGNPFLVEGHLSGTGSANHEVVLQANPYPYLGGFKIVGNPEVTSSTGGFSFPYVGLLENAQLRVVAVSQSGKPEQVSPVVTENVAVKVSFHARRAQRRDYEYLYGTVAPAEVDARVGFQLLQPGRSLNEGGTIVKAATPTTSSFGRIVRVRRPGLYRALVLISDGAHVYSYSDPLLVR
ncbi:MAG TPA: fibronectin type III domain-containing protein [Solirubrobacteraceae bacterium]|nr:fibronectin type III domain-containing protein [Solirubrobacteraceae bacterium]